MKGTAGVFKLAAACTAAALCTVAHGAQAGASADELRAMSRGSRKAARRRRLPLRASNKQ